MCKYKSIIMCIYIYILCTFRFMSCVWCPVWCENKTENNNNNNDR